MSPIKLLALLIAFSGLGACTSGPSTYRSTTTAEQHVVEASGDAAVAAAQSNQAYNCQQGCPGGARMIPAKTAATKPRRNRRNPVNRAVDTATVEFSMEMDRAIREFIDFERWGIR